MWNLCLFLTIAGLITVIVGGLLALSDKWIYIGAYIVMAGAAIETVAQILHLFLKSGL